mgnify:CR=1 FL=1
MLEFIMKIYLCWLTPLKKIAKEYGDIIKFKIISYFGNQRIREIFKSLEKFIEIDYGSKYWLPMKKFAELIYDFDILMAPLQEDNIGIEVRVS